jgi:hypothetical protein
MSRTRFPASALCLCASLLALVCTALPGVARAETLVGAVAATAARPGEQQCAALFGDVAARRANAALRARNLDWIDEEQSGVTIAHAAEGWEEPTRIEVKGLRLLRTRPDAGIAEVQLSSSAARTAGCAAVTYLVGVDAALGFQARVLAILRHGVLVERRGQLVFLSSRGVPPPRWLLAWRMRATLRPLTPGSEEIATVSSPYGRSRGGDD